MLVKSGRTSLVIWRSFPILSVIFRDVIARSYYDEAIRLFCLPRQIDFLFDWGHPLRHPVEERDPSIPSTEGNPVAIHPFPTKQKSPKHL